MVGGAGGASGDGLARSGLVLSAEARVDAGLGAARPGETCVSSRIALAQGTALCDGPHALRRRRDTPAVAPLETPTPRPPQPRGARRRSGGDGPLRRGHGMQVPAANGRCAYGEGPRLQNSEPGGGGSRAERPYPDFAGALLIRGEASGGAPRENEGVAYPCHAKPSSRARVLRTTLRGRLTQTRRGHLLPGASPRRTPRPATP